MKSKGFSMVELLVVVAIISLLAAIAIPQFRRYQYKAMRSEALILLKAAHAGQITYYSTYDQFYPPNAPSGGGEALEGSGRSTRYFGLPNPTKWGWDWDGWRAMGPPAGQPDRSIGYRVRLDLNMDPSDPGPDRWIIQVPPTVSDPLGICPVGVPYHRFNDLNKQPHPLIKKFPVVASVPDW